jgi:glutathione-regulated potassium-efflux system ancillary protein KefG
VLQVPVRWGSAPPPLKAWQDAALTRRMHLAPDTEGRLLAGKPLMVAATAGNTADSDRPGGRNLFAMDALLAPLRATVHRCALAWAAPFILCEAKTLASKALEAAARAYAARLAAWRTETSAEAAA